MGLMRENYDLANGEGAWDKMHDAIDRGELGGWSLPPMIVDGMRVHIFPGSNRDATVEDVEEQIRKAMLQIADGDYEQGEI